MTEAEFLRLLSNLSKSIEVLNKKSDAMNSLIERFQTTLRDLNPGVQTLESRRALYHDAEPSPPARTARTVPLVRQSPGARTSRPAAPGRSRGPCRRCCE
jgi:hypothetical protein